MSTWAEDEKYWDSQGYNKDGPYDGRWTHIEESDNCVCDGCRWAG